MAGPYGPVASDVVHKYPQNQSLVPNQGLDSADPDSIPLLLLPQLWRGGGGGCEGTPPSGIGTRHGVALPGRVKRERIFGATPVAGRPCHFRCLKHCNFQCPKPCNFRCPLTAGAGALREPGSVRRAAGPCEAGTARPVPQRVVKGSQPTQCNTLGLARGSGPFEPPTGENSPLAPPSPPPLPSPSPMTEASMAQEATGKRLTASCPPLNPRALPGRLDFLTPWHTRTPRNASWTNFPLRDRRSRRLWGNRIGRLIRPDLGSARWPSRQGSLWRERPRKRGGEVVDFGVHHLPLPGGAPAPKNPGSLPPLPPPPGVAHRARRGHARRRPATVVAAGAGNPYQPVSHKAFQARP